MATENEAKYLALCVDLAREALEAGDAPFGSVLVGRNGDILRTDRNRITTGASAGPDAGKPDPTLHPEFTLARWAMLNLSADERAATTMYTSGEHCAMCSAAHAYCGLGPIVYASSTKQLGAWMKENNISGGRVNGIAINDVAPGISVKGPTAPFDEQVHQLQLRRWQKGN